MQVWTEIRRKVLVEKVSRRQICRDYGLSHHTLAKMLENVEPPGYQQRQGERPRPKLGPFLEVIEEILRLDQTAPKKQRHTAKRGQRRRLTPRCHSCQHRRNLRGDER